MKNQDRLFSERYWLPVFGLGAIVFLAAALAGAYFIWDSKAEDDQNIQKIQEFNSASIRLLFFSQKVVTADVDAISALVSTSDGMDQIIEHLVQADDFTKEQLANEYAAAAEAWSSIHNKVAQISELESSLNLLEMHRQTLDERSVVAQQVLGGLVVRMIAQGGKEDQVSMLRDHAMLLRQMSKNMQQFLQEEQSDSRFYDAYRSDIVNFYDKYGEVSSVQRTTGLAALAGDEELIAGIQAVYEYVESLRIEDPELLTAAEAVIQARKAHSDISFGLTGLSLTLDRMGQGIDVLSSARPLQPIYIIAILIAAVLCVAGFVVAQRRIAKKLLEAEQYANEKVQAAILRLLDELADLADGDLTVTTTVSEDFTGAIADSVNYTIDQLRQLVSRINSTAVQVSTAAQESQQTALHLAEASDHQAQEIAGVSAAINEMAVTIDQVSANAAESALVASKSVSIANNGAKLVQNTIHGMDTIREQIQDTSKRIKRLGESSQEIGDIVSLINDIADQTNILALNAAIQASMAGDAGRGFAVVADEVQRLAERSAGATKQIETLVKTIQTDTNEAVTSMEQTTSEVVSGARLALDAGVALEEIEGVSANIAELIQNISNAARQQASSAGHISNTMNVIQEITSQTSAGTGATAQAIGDLADMALELRESVAGFTLPDDMDTDGEVDDSVWLSADDMGVPVSALDIEEPEGVAGIDLDIGEMAEADTDVMTNIDLDIDEDLDVEAFNLADVDESYDLDEVANIDEVALDVEMESAEMDSAEIATEEVDEASELLDGLASMAEDESMSGGLDKDLDFSEEMLSLADSEEIDLLDDEFDLSDFDFVDEKEKDFVS